MRQNRGKLYHDYGKVTERLKRLAENNEWESLHHEGMPKKKRKVSPSGAEASQVHFLPAVSASDILPQFLNHIRSRTPATTTSSANFRHGCRQLCCHVSQTFSATCTSRRPGSPACRRASPPKHARSLPCPEFSHARTACPKFRGRDTTSIPTTVHSSASTRTRKYSFRASSISARNFCWKTGSATS